MPLLIVYAVLAIGFSFLCSILEAVLLSISPAYISSLPEDSALKETLKHFKEDIDRPLSAILTLNTIAHTVGAILVGSQAAKIYANGAGYEELIVSIIMTLLILILSEIIPKTLGANFWRSWTPFTVTSLKFLLGILAPLVWVSQLITKRMKNDKESSVLSRADFSALAYSGEQSGALKEEESRTIRNLLRLDQITVKSIMTPRSVVTSGVSTDTLKSLYDNYQPFRYSRIPIFDESKEHVVGVLLKNVLLKGLYENKGEELVSAHTLEPLFIKESDKLSKLQDVLMEGKNHIAVVVFETILGLEIVDETDDVADLQKHARELWEKRSKGLNMS